MQATTLPDEWQCYHQRLKYEGPPPNGFKSQAFSSIQERPLRGVNALDISKRRFRQSWHQQQRWEAFLEQRRRIPLSLWGDMPPWIASQLKQNPYEGKCPDRYPPQSVAIAAESAARRVG
ncbi:MAG: hypothetical protein ACFBSG_16025 [Leptolyngbyaceae cyanobacterium]